MKYQKTRYALARALAAILTLTVVFGLSAPLITQAASNVSVLYRYDGDGTETKNRVGIRSIIINDKKYFDIHDGSITDRVDPNNQIAFLQAVLQSGNETDGGTDSLIGQWASLAEQIYGTHNKYAAYVNAGGGFAKNFTGEENRTRNGYADVAYAALILHDCCKPDNTSKKNLRVIERVGKIILIGQDLLMLRI